MGLGVSQCGASRFKLSSGGEYLVERKHLPKLAPSHIPKAMPFHQASRATKRGCLGAVVDGLQVKSFVLLVSVWGIPTYYELSGTVGPLVNMIINMEKDMIFAALEAASWVDSIKYLHYY
jgi:hypothetical protein